MQLFSEGKRLVEEDRQKDYGDPKRLWSIVAQFWGLLFQIFGMTPRTCAAAMLLLKVIRELINHKQDNLDDIEGYAYIIGKLWEGKNDRG